MLKKPNRLKSRGEFKRTLAAVKLCGNDCFSVFALLRSDTQKEAVPDMQPRIGFIVSKKVHKKSTRRNRIKRRLRELVRTWLLTERQEKVLPYRSLVFIARSRSVDASYHDLKSRMARCFE